MPDALRYDDRFPGGDLDGSVPSRQFEADRDRPGLHGERLVAVGVHLASVGRVAGEFLVRAFGLVERREARMEHPTGMLAWLELGSGVIMIGRAGPDHHGLASPVDTGAPTAMVDVSVEDVDAHHRRAAAEGAHVQNEPEDMLWGDRRYEVLDLDGHRWHFAQRRVPTQDLSPP